MKHVPRQRGLWTPPPGVSTAIFRDKLRGIQTKKRNGGHVDLFLLYNIKSDQCPQDPGGSRAEANLLSFDLYGPPGTLGGALSLSTVRCVIQNLGVWPSPEKNDEGGRGARVAGGQKEKRRSSKRKSTAAGSSKRHFRLGGICGRPHYERMQVMQRNLTTASVNYNCK